MATASVSATEAGAAEGDASARLWDLTALLRDVPASDLATMARTAGDALGASEAKILVADYGLTSLQELGDYGPTGVRTAIDGTSAGLSFARGSIIVAPDEPTVWLPLAEGSERIGVLELETGELTWVNAGHPLPLLVRDGTYVGPLTCRPSLPLGLGGQLHELGSDRLQRGDRVLFYTDGVIEARDADNRQFGIERLADFLVRATLDGVSPAETLRRLSGSIMDYDGAELDDDATLFLLEYHGTA